MSEISTPNVFDTKMVSELVGSADVSQLEGKLKTFIDSLGLPERQEKATKDIVQEIIWDWFYFIRDHFTDYLSDKRSWYVENRLTNKNQKIGKFNLLQEDFCKLGCNCGWNLWIGGKEEKDLEQIEKYIKAIK